jgi:hypothetical protein
VREQPPAYGFICLSCGQTWGPEDGYVKHTDPATGEKCRDITGSSSVPSKMGPVAERPWGPRGVYSELDWEANYDYGYMPPTQDAVRAYLDAGQARIEAALAGR